MNSLSGPSSNFRPYKKRRKFKHRDRHTERTDSVKTQGKDHGSMEAEVVVMQPQAKELLELPEAGAGQESPILKVSEGRNPADDAFRLLASKTLR